MTRLNYHVQLIPHGQKVSKRCKGLVNQTFSKPPWQKNLYILFSKQNELENGPMFR